MPEELRTEPLFEVAPPEEFSYNWGEMEKYQEGIPGRRAHAKCVRCLRLFFEQPVHPLLLHDPFCPSGLD